MKSHGNECKYFIQSFYAQQATQQRKKKEINKMTKAKDCDNNDRLKFAFVYISRIATPDKSIHNAVLGAILFT